jgi:hypothetical protein
MSAVHEFFLGNYQMTMNNTQIAIGILVFIFFLYVFMSHKRGSRALQPYEGYTAEEEYDEEEYDEDEYDEEEYDEEEYDEEEYDEEEYDEEEYGEERFTELPQRRMLGSADLLPQPTLHGDSDFSKFAPRPLNGNFLSAHRFIGADTTGSSMRNSSYDLRRIIPVKKQAVSPWNNSTIEPDKYRRPLDI